MPPVRTLLFLVPLVKALRPSTTPAKQLSTASSIKARVASQNAVDTKKVRTTYTSTDIYLPEILRFVWGFLLMLICYFTSVNTHNTFLLSMQLGLLDC